MSRDDEYLQRWRDIRAADEESVDFVSRSGDIYKTIKNALYERMQDGEITPAHAANISLALYIQIVIDTDGCPGCDLFEASKEIHDRVGCRHVH